MRFLYPITLANNKDNQELYFKIEGAAKQYDKEIKVAQNSVLDFFTYFNSFSVKKWKNYTTIKNICLNINVLGDFVLSVIGATLEKEVAILTKNLKSGSNQVVLNVASLDFDIIGFSLKCTSVEGRFLSAHYEGDFESWSDETVRIVICTFKREEYILKNLNYLNDIIEQNDWLNVTVVDNGNSLVLPDELKAKVKLVSNRNYGGSGGFTRGMIDTIESTSDSYVLLMDDDIYFDSSSIIRTYALICGLKQGYKKSYIAGAMLEMENPVIQYENKAYWDKFRLKTIGEGLNLASRINLIHNEVEIVDTKNQYGAWWFCCMPVKRIKELGYPLPVFIKGDDMEFGIRNKAPLISLNGIGVWHASFASKISPVVNYYSDRNMLIINNYAENCGFTTFLIAVCGRFVKRSLQGSSINLQMLAKAYQDYGSSFEGITAKRADEKMQEIIEYSKEKHNVLSLLAKNIYLILKLLIRYSKTRKAYISFRETNLRESTFWKKYLGI
ncbi:hypothetical protein [Veillonella seminalis]|uniref:hypothetical protein n=1 Tax=Veillonella seminalis TaxID=1502943 RepID=UPI00402A63C3